MSTSTQEMQRKAEQLQPRIESIRSELDRVEQEVRFSQQTSGYPSTQPDMIVQQQQQQQQQQWYAEAERELHALKERVNTFNREISEKIEAVTRAQQQAQHQAQLSSFSSGFSPQSSQARWAQPLIQAVRETLDVAQQTVSAVSSSSSKQS